MLQNGNKHATSVMQSWADAEWFLNKVSPTPLHYVPNTLHACFAHLTGSRDRAAVARLVDAFSAKKRLWSVSIIN